MNSTAGRVGSVVSRATVPLIRTQQTLFSTRPPEEIPKLNVPKAAALAVSGVIASYFIYQKTIPTTFKKPEGRSPTEKQFYEFASLRDGESWFMTREDFCHACGMRDWEFDNGSGANRTTTSGNPNWLQSLQKRWDQRKEALNISEDVSKHDLNDVIGFFRSLDVDGDGKISLQEFGTFVQLLRAPDADVRALFQRADLNHDGRISVTEFRKALRTYLPHLSKHSHLFDPNTPFITKFFGIDSKKKLTYGEFQGLMDDLENEIVLAEFTTLASEDAEKIPVTCITQYLIEKSKAGVIPKHVLENLYQLKETKEKNENCELDGITFAEFRALHEFLKHIHVIEKFIQVHHTQSLTKEQFRNAMKDEWEYELVMEEIDWVFSLFANPDTGKLDFHSFTVVCNNLRSDFPEAPKMQLYQSMLLGGVSAMAGATTVFPLDKIKTRIQSSPVGANQSIFSVMKDIVQKEGPLKLYRGIQAQLVGITPEKAVKLTVNDYLRKRMIKKHQLETGDTNVQLSMTEEMLAGMGTGMIQVFITNPIEVVKIRLQMQTAGQIQSPFSVIRNLGVRGLYTGMSATILRDVPFNMMYFSSYQGMKKLFTAREEKKRESTEDSNQQIDLSAGQLLISSCVAGSIAAGLDTPADGIKTRLQNGQGNYTGIVDCVKKVYATEGLGGLFRGWTARILIISPLFGITMMCYEMLQRFFFPHTQIGLEILDEDFASMRRSRLHYVDKQLQLRYGIQEHE